MPVTTSASNLRRLPLAVLVVIIAAALSAGLAITATGAQAAAPKKPSTNTRPATAIAGQTATLTARVNPQGQATSVYIRYGKTKNYGTRTAVVPAGAGTANVDIPIPVTGLAADTKYYFQAVATNATGTTRGARRSFKTTRGITGVSSEAEATRVTWNTSATVRGTVDGVKPGGSKVVLMRQDHPFTSGYRQVATQTTSSAGAYSFDTGPLYEAVRFMVVTTDVTPITSRVLSIDNRLWNRVFVKTRRAATYSLSGRVYPMVRNGFATLQRRTPSGRWMKLERIKLRHDETRNRSTYSVRVKRLTTRSARHRVVVTPKDDRAHVETPTSTVLVKKRR